MVIVPSKRYSDELILVVVKCDDMIMMKRNTSLIVNNFLIIIINRFSSDFIEWCTINIIKCPSFQGGCNRLLTLYS